MQAALGSGHLGAIAPTVCMISRFLTIAEIMSENPERSRNPRLDHFHKQTATQIVLTIRSSESANLHRHANLSERCCNLFGIVVSRTRAELSLTWEKLPPHITILHTAHSSPKPPSNRNVPFRTFRAPFGPSRSSSSTGNPSPMWPICHAM